MKNDLPKILIISDNPLYGGGEAFIRNTLINLQNNFDVSYLVSNTELFDALPDTKTMFCNEKSTLSKIKNANSIVNKLLPSVIILNGGRSIFYAPFIKKKDIKIIIYRHATNRIVFSLVKRFIYILLQHVCYAFADKIIHVSSYSLNEQKWLKNKAVFIYHGVYPLSYKKHNFLYPLQLLFVGRLDKSKGIDIIIEALKNISPSLMTLHIVGAGEMDKYIKENSAKNIIYHGFSENPQIYYEICDIFISMPIVESFGLTILEAMNNSMPIITTKVGAIPEIARPANSIFSKRTVKDLTEVLLSVSKIPRNKLILMGEYSNELAASKFQKEITLKNITAEIQSIL